MCRKSTELESVTHAAVITGLEMGNDACAPPLEYGRKQLWPVCVAVFPAYLNIATLSNDTHLMKY